MSGNVKLPSQSEVAETQYRHHQSAHAKQGTMPESSDSQQQQHEQYQQPSGQHVPISHRPYREPDPDEPAATWTCSDCMGKGVHFSGCSRIRCYKCGKAGHWASQCQLHFDGMPDDACVRAVFEARRRAKVGYINNLSDYAASVGLPPPQPASISGYVVQVGLPPAQPVSINGYLAQESRWDPWQTPDGPSPWSAASQTAGKKARTAAMGSSSSGEASSSSGEASSTSGEASGPRNSSSGEASSSSGAASSS